MFSRLTAVALLVAVALGLWLACPAPLTAMDQEQARLSQTAPIPSGDTTVGQTFVAAHDGLSAVELLAAVYPDAPAGAVLTLRLLDSDGRVVAAHSFSGVAHNTSLRLNFNPLPHSARKTYTLLLEGTPDNKTTVWAYGLDGYARGTRLENGAPAPGDLRFSTSYTYLWSEALGDVVSALGRLARLALPLWLILFAPGLLVLEWIGRYDDQLPSVWARWGMALGFSLSLLPLAWLWITVIGLKWSAAGIWVAYALAGLAVLWRGLARLSAASNRHEVSGRRPSAHDAAIALILFLSLAARLLAVRDLAFPQWVDSPHHLIIARLLDESGRVPAGYVPLLPIEQFIYHFGFHALAATVHWLTALPLVEVFLLVGQLLNGLTSLAAYTFVVGLTGRPRAGLAAAFFVGLVSLFPGYYVSWGRYTQLTGVLILAPALVAAWRMVRPRADGRAAFKGIFAVSLLAAGLLLTHYRVLAFFAVFALAALAGGGRGGWKGLGAATTLAMLLTAPWLLRLGAQAVMPVVIAPGTLASPSGYNAFPVEYFQRGLERGWMLIALLATTWGLLRLTRVVWITAGWVAVTFALLNMGPGTWVVNNNSWAITLFLPGALALGWGVERWLNLTDTLGREMPAAKDFSEWGVNVSLTLQRLRPDTTWIRRIFRVAMLMCLAGLAAYAGLQGLVGQVSISNPTTVLATADDQSALEWIEKNTPAEAVFLVNGWPWQSGTWAGPDGGVWVWPLTGRRTTLPPLDYTLQADLEAEVNAFNERAAQIQDASAPETLGLLREAGVTHIFIGAKGGTLKPEMFVENPNYRLLHTNGAAWVFEVIGP
ncbi:MAG: conserved rane protein of unknown function [Anaerolineales bacterium]|nr:conserved rane protein of unknown function [Anaerolineales bacterium]